MALIPFGACMPGDLHARLGAILKRGALSVLFVVIALVVIAPYLIQNMATYGVPIPAQESVRIREMGVGGIVEYARATMSIDWWGEVTSWWTRGTLVDRRLEFIRPAKVWRTLYLIVIAGGVIAWVRELARPSLRSSLKRRSGGEPVRSAHFSSHASRWRWPPTPSAHNWPGAR